MEPATDAGQAAGKSRAGLQPRRPVGGRGCQFPLCRVTDLSWHFAQTAEAHDAYLVTELGNLFQVETPTVGGGNGTDLGALNAGVTQALLGFMAGITEKEADFQFLTGTNSVGDLHDYSPFFMIPQNVVNSSGGYVGTYKANGPHTSVPIPTFFSTYRYDDATNILHDTGYGSNLPAFDSVEITAHDNSRKQSGSVPSSYDGFYVYNTGTYIVKLQTGMAYHVPNDMQCVGGVCDRASIISSDSNLLGTTTSGLFLKNANVGRAYSAVSGEIPRHGTPSATMRMTGTIPFGGEQISSTDKIQRHGANTASPELFWKCTYYDPSNPPYYESWAIRSLGTRDMSFINPLFSTSTNDGKKFLNGIRFETDFYVSYSNCSTLPFNRDFDRWGNRIYIINEPTGPLSDITYMTFPSVAQTVYDTGVPVRHHFAYWADNQTDSMYRDTATAYNPNNIVVNDNNMYMILEKNTVGPYVDVTANNVTNAVLEIADLAPDTLFTITDSNGAYFVVGVTDRHGEITIPYAAQPFASVSGLKLNLFHDSLVFRQLSGMTVIDHFNGAQINVNTAKRDGTLYVTTKYVDMPISLDSTEVASVGVGLSDCDASRLDLPYLAGTYNGGDNLLVPIIPGYDRVCYEIGGKSMTLKYADIRQSDDVDFGESGNALNEVGGAPTGHASAQTQTSIQITVVESGPLVFGVDGMVRGHADVYYAREYIGEVKMPGDNSFEPDTTDRRRGTGSICDDTIYIPGWSNLAITNFHSESGSPPEPSGHARVSVEVSKNGAVVFTKTLLSEDMVTDSFRPVNTGDAQRRIGAFDLTLYSSNGNGYWCYPQDTDSNIEMADKIRDGEYMLCNSGLVVYWDAFTRYVRVPVCERPDRAAECGYDVSQSLSRSAFGETITVNNVEIGDVIDVEIAAGSSVGLGEYTCTGQPTGNDFKRGTVELNILNPSVQVQ